MKITIDSKVLKKNNLTIGQFLLMLSYHYKITEEEFNDLLNKHFYISTSNGKREPYLSDKGAAIINKIILEGDNLNAQEKDELNQLAKKMQDLFPVGKKLGTNYYWRGNVREIENKLQVFFKKYGEFPEEEIIKATENYLNAYADDKRFMQLLKYFIMKNVAKGGVTETQSELLTYIENLHNNDSNSEVLITTRLI